MTTKVKQFTTSFKTTPKVSFFELTKKHIAKERKRANRNLSKPADELDYKD